MWCMTVLMAATSSPTVAFEYASPYTLITRESERVTLKTLIHASVSYSTWLEAARLFGFMHMKIWQVLANWLMKSWL